MQDYLALSIVAVAAAYLAWRGWKFFYSRKQAACGSACDGCAKSDLPSKVEVHTISAQWNVGDATSPIAR
jgi:hypothetical protein